MRTIPLALIALAALSLSTSLSTTGARAEGTWCANYGTGHGGGINCSYTSFEQCRATVSPRRKHRGWSELPLRPLRNSHRAAATPHPSPPHRASGGLVRA